MKNSVPVDKHRLRQLLRTSENEIELLLTLDRFHLLHSWPRRIRPEGSSRNTVEYPPPLLTMALLAAAATVTTSEEALRWPSWVRARASGTPQWGWISPVAGQQPCVCCQDVHVSFGIDLEGHLNERSKSKMDKVPLMRIVLLLEAILHRNLHLLLLQQQKNEGRGGRQKLIQKRFWVCGTGRKGN